MNLSLILSSRQKTICFSIFCSKKMYSYYSFLPHQPKSNIDFTLPIFTFYFIMFSVHFCYTI